MAKGTVREKPLSLEERTYGSKEESKEEKITLENPRSFLVSLGPLSERAFFFGKARIISC